MISWVDFGKPNKSETVSEPVVMENLEDYFWSFTNEGVRIGENDSNAFAYAQSGEMDKDVTNLKNGDFKGVYTIFDTGEPNILISRYWFDALVIKLYQSAGTVYEKKDGILYSTCKVSFPNLYFLINGYWLMIPPQDYMSDASDA